MMKKSNIKTAFVFSFFIIVPLTAGLSVYLLHNSSTYVSRLIYTSLNIKPEIINYRSEFFHRYFCDICWAFSLESSVYAVLPKEKMNAVWSAFISTALSSLFEILQLTGVISGTFDIGDIVAETIAIIMAGLILYIFLRRLKQ